MAAYYPRLYHMAAGGSWPSIKRFGLMSTSALLDLFEIADQRRWALESQHRRKSEEIWHPVHGRAVVRDQKPLNEKKLAKVLDDDLSPADWYRMLNQRVFFWLYRKKRLDSLVEAYAHTRQTVITLDTRLLIERHAERVELSPINSGATYFNAARRGTRTFLPLSEYPWQERRQYRRQDRVAELTVVGAVSDVADLVVEVMEVGGNAEPTLILSKLA